MNQRVRATITFTVEWVAVFRHYNVITVQDLLAAIKEELEAQPIEMLEFRMEDQGFIRPSVTVETV